MKKDSSYLNAKTKRQKPSMHSMIDSLVKPKDLQTYTLVGFYEDNDQAYTTDVQAKNALEAVLQAPEFVSIVDILIIKNGQIRSDSLWPYILSSEEIDELREGENTHILTETPE